MRGRADVLSAVAAALDDAVQGRGRFLLLTGEAGIGKSALAREAVLLARERGMDVGWGTCLAGHLAAPYAPWLEILPPEGAAVLASAGQAVRAGSDARDVEWERLLAFRGVVEQLRSRAEAHALLVVLDDLHWADTPSQLLLCHVAGHLITSRVVVLAACRDDELHAGAPVVTLLAGVDRVALGGLDVAAVAGLVGDVTGQPLDGLGAERLRQVTGGNPFFVIQVARLGMDRGGRVADLPVPTEVEAVLGRRLAHLDERTVGVLRSAAILGGPADADLVAEVAGEGRDDVLAALERAERARIVRQSEDDPRWGFVHELFQRVCSRGLSAAARMELHGRAAAVLERRGASATAIAQHLHRAGLGASDPRPAHADLAAGREAMAQLAWEEARAHFERAAASAPRGADHDELRLEALLGLGEARRRAGDLDGAGVAFEEAARLGRRLDRPDVVARAALGFGAGFGGFEVQLFHQRQIDLLEEAAGLLPSASPLRPWLLARLSVALSFVGSDARRLALADEAIELGRRSGDPAVLAAALASRCDALAGPDSVAERLSLASQMVALARQAGDRPLELLGRRLRVVALSESGRMGEADDEIAAFERVALARGDPLFAWYVPLWRGMRALSRGDLAGAERWADEAETTGAAGGSANAGILSDILRLVILVERRSADLPDRYQRAAMKDRTLLGPNGVPMLVWGLALIGEKAEARRRVGEIAASGLDRMHKADAEWLPAMTQLAEAVAALEDVGLAAEVRPRLEPYGEACVVEGIAAANRGSVHRPLALLAALLGDRDAALAALDRARVVDGAIGALPAAHTRWATAWVLDRLGDRRDRPRLVEEARRAAREYRAMGLDAQAAEAEALAGGAATTGASGDGPSAGELRREGDAWALTWDAVTVRVRHSKGLGDLARLLASPGAALHVRDLEAGTTAVPPTPPDPRLDRRAAAEYRRRLDELQEEVARAESAAAGERASRLRAEREFLVAELKGAFGLGGRPRPAAGDVDERRRKAVSARIHHALSRLEEVHPSAAHHLRHSVETGVWCSYRPERPTRWHVEGA